MKIINFRGDLTDNSTRKEALLGTKWCTKCMLLESRSNCIKADVRIEAQVKTSAVLFIMNLIYFWIF